MRLILKHVEKTKAGSWQYRRRVPKAVSLVITKREFKQKLGDSEREALANYARYHAQVEQEIAKAQKRILHDHALAMGLVSDHEAYTVARRRVREVAAFNPSPEELAIAAEVLVASYPQDPETEDPIGASKVDEFTINLLRLGERRYPPPPATLSDALTLYLKERHGDDTSEDAKRFEGAARRIVGHVQDALGVDPVLVSLTRDDARQVRDHMLDRIKSNGEKINPASVARDLNSLKAIINHAAIEMPLPSTFQNPFNKLTVESGRSKVADGDKRHPLPQSVVEAARQRIIEHGKPALALIWRLLEGTGCRVAEVAGLTVEDVRTDGEFPHISITGHAHRRLKTTSSRRDVPLVGDALDAAREALRMPRKSNLLFPEYGSDRGGDKASAALMKHLRFATTNRKHVVHSLRHNMKDRLRLAEIASLDQNLILGHAEDGVGDRVYGGSLAKLKVTTRAMRKAFGIVETPES